MTASTKKISILGVTISIVLASLFYIKTNVENKIITELEKNKKDFNLESYSNVSCLKLLSKTCSINNPVFSFNNTDKITMDKIDIKNLENIAYIKEDKLDNIPKNLYLKAYNIKVNGYNLLWADANLDDLKFENKDFYSFLKTNFDKNINISIDLNSYKKDNASFYDVKLNSIIDTLNLKNEIFFSKDLNKNVVISKLAFDLNFKKDFINNFYYEYYKNLYNIAVDKKILNNMFSIDSEQLVSKIEFEKTLLLSSEKLINLIKNDQSSLIKYLNKDNQFVNKLNNLFINKDNTIYLSLENPSNYTNADYFMSGFKFLNSGELSKDILDTRLLIK